MVRKMMTGFESGNLTNFLASNGFSIVSTDKRSGVYSAYTGGDCAGWLYCEGKLTEMYIRFGIKHGSATGGTCFTIVNSNGGIAFQMGWVAGGLDLYVHRGWYQQLMGQGGAIPISTWACVELYIKLSTTVGVVSMKVNGNVIFTYNGNTIADTNFPDVTYIVPGCPNGNASGSNWYDDIAVNDTTGGHNDTWIGQSGIVLGYVNGDSAVEPPELTPSAGANWQCVDERPASDADYVSGNGLGDQDLYTLDTSALPAAGIVSAVKMIMRAKLDIDGGSITPLVRQGGASMALSDIPVTSSYADKGLVLDVDPTDSGQWTIAKVASLEVGVAVGAPV